jgi:hypothetical protein
MIGRGLESLWEILKTQKYNQENPNLWMKVRSENTLLSYLMELPPIDMKR